MAETSVELVRRMLDRFHGGDAEGALACFSADIVTEVKGRADASIGHGRQELGEIIGSWVAEWEAWSQEIEEIRDLGDKVLVISMQRGRARKTGIDVSTRFAMLYEVRSGELSRVTLYGSEAEALTAAGLRE